MASLRPLLATPSPALSTPPASVSTTAPEPTDRSRPWTSVVLETLPLATALPVHTHASPSEVLVAAPELFATVGPTTVTTAGVPVAEANAASWEAVAVFVDSLPVASLRPLLAMPTPRLATPAAWVPTIRPSCFTSLVWCWVTVVADTLPLARAPPVPTLAVPSEVFLASPELLAVTEPRPVRLTGPPVLAESTLAIWPSVVLLLDVLPVASLRPLLATPSPTLATPATWVLSAKPRVSMVPPWTWSSAVVDTLPWAWAPPVRMVALPSDVLAAVPALAASSGPAAVTSTGPAVLFEPTLAVWASPAPASLPGVGGLVAGGLVEAAVGHARPGVEHAAHLGVEDQPQALDVAVLALEEVRGRGVAGGVRLAGGDARGAVRAGLGRAAVGGADAPGQDGGRAGGCCPSATLAIWPRVAVLSESLPVAELPPLLATPAPRLATPAVCVLITVPSPSTLPVWLWARRVALGCRWPWRRRWRSWPCRRRCVEAMPELVSVRMPAVIVVAPVLPEPTLAVWVAVALLSDSLPVAVLLPLLATPSPALITPAVWLLRIRPSPSTEPVESCEMAVPLALPVAEALPVAIVAEPSDEFEASPLLAPTSVPAVIVTGAALPEPMLAVCVSVAVLPESLPVAVLLPESAVAVPVLATVAVWTGMTRPVGSMLWLIQVLESLPVAEALPVAMDAVPSEVLSALPKFPITPTSTPEGGRLAVWDPVAVLPDSLPVPSLPPLLAVPSPLLATVLPCV